LSRFRFELGPVPLHHQVYIDLRRGLEAATRVIAARPESAGETIAAALDIEPGSPILSIERLRLGGGEPLLLEQVHLPAERFPGLLALDLERASLYDVLARRYAVRIVRTREVLEPVLLRSREARLLGSRPGDPALQIDGIAFAADGRPVEASRTYVRGGRTRYYVERSVERPDQVGAGIQRQAEEELRHAVPEHEIASTEETTHA
jgi:GntR family transcriptional regulator